MDAHWSQGLSSKNEYDVPLNQECVIIDNEYLGSSAIIVIDDVRMFGTVANEDWSYISHDSVKKSFKNFNILFSKEVDDRLLMYIERNEK